MALRVCSTPGCPKLITPPRRRCHTCSTRYEQARGSSTARGYGADHAQAKRASQYVNATHCATCGEPFTPANPKTAGHRIAIRNGGRDSGIKPECRRCNYGWRRSGS